jgi:hypothetical protein
MNLRVKLIGGLILGVIALLVITSVSRELFVTNNQGYYQVKQAAITGTVTVHSDSGTYGRFFGEITSYHVSDMYYFSKSDNDGGSSSLSDPIDIRFNDGGTAKVSGGIKFRLPSDPEHQVLLHRDFKNYERVKHDLIRQTVAEALMQTATLMKAEESYSTRRSEFTSLVEDQVKNGIYETEAKEYKVKDADGNEFIEHDVKVKKDAAGQPIVRKVSPLKMYNVDIVQFVIKDLDFDKTIDNLIQKKKEAEQMKVVARANAEKAKQDAITAREQGNASIAVEKATQEVEKIKEVTIAQKNFEVSQLQRKQAEQDALATITKGKAEAEINKLKVAAGLTPLERATIDKDTAIGVATQLAQVQFPGMMILGGGNGGHALNPFDAVGLESFMRISKDLAASKAANQKTPRTQKNQSEEEN